MPKKMPIDIDSFATILDTKNNYFYIDKSLWIKEIIDDNNNAVLITRPRFWGKTINLSMLQHFFAAHVAGHSTKGLFDTLQIAKVDNQRYLAYQGRYPVILLSLKDIEELNYEGALELITLQIRKCYKEHAYLLTSPYLSTAEKEVITKFLYPISPATETELVFSLQLLTRILFLHYREPAYILVDDYDSPLIHASMQGYLEKLTRFFKLFFSETLKTSSYLKKAIMVGNLQITKESMLSDFNNLSICNLLNKQHQQYFGFTEFEIDTLFMAVGLMQNADKVKNFYNSYKIGEIVLYNPWSIVHCIDNNGNPRPHWVNTASDTLLKKIYLNTQASADIKFKFQQLLSNKSSTTTINEKISFEEIDKGDDSAIWSLLLFRGYLKAVAVLPEHTHYRCMLYNDILSQFLVEHTNKASYDNLLSSLIAGDDVETFTKTMYAFILENNSNYYYSRQPAAFNQGFILALTASLSSTYITQPYLRNSYSHRTILYIPKDQKQSTAICLQFRQTAISSKQSADEVAQAALAEIKSAVPETELNQYTHLKQLLKIGLGFADKSLCAAYTLESIGQTIQAMPSVKLTAIYGEQMNESSVPMTRNTIQASKHLASNLLAPETADQLTGGVLYTDTVTIKPRL